MKWCPQHKLKLKEWNTKEKKQTLTAESLYQSPLDLWGHYSLIFLQKTTCTSKDCLWMDLDLLKVESISCVPDCPCRGCPSLQLQLAKLLLHLPEEKEKVSGLIPAFMNSSLEHSPHILCKWAQQVSKM